MLGVERNSFAGVACWLLMAGCSWLQSLVSCRALNAYWRFGGGSGSSGGGGGGGVGVRVEAVGR